MNMGYEAAKPSQAGNFSHIRVDQCSGRGERNFFYEEEIQCLAENEWYMNKFVGLKLVKAVNQENGRPFLKTKRIEDILLYRPELYLEKLQVANMEVLFQKGKESSTLVQQTSMNTNCIPTKTLTDEVHDGQNHFLGKIESTNRKQSDIVESDYPVSSHSHFEGGKRKRIAECPLQSVEKEYSDLPSDDDFEIDNLTIKELQHFFKGTARKLSREPEMPGNKKRSSQSPPQIKALSLGRNNKKFESRSGTLVGLDYETPVDTFDLQINSLNSSKVVNNGSESSTVESVNAIVDCCTDDKSGILLCLTKDAEVDCEDAERISWELKKGMADCGVNSVTEGSTQCEAAQDEWTLEMWLSKQRKSSKRKLLDMSEHNQVLVSPRQSDIPRNGFLGSGLNQDGPSLLSKRPLEISVDIQENPRSADSGTCVESSSCKDDIVSIKCVQVMQERVSPLCNILAEKPRVRLVLEDELECGVSKLPSLEGLLEFIGGTPKTHWPLQRCIKTLNPSSRKDKSCDLKSSCSVSEPSSDRKFSTEIICLKPQVDFVVLEKDIDVGNRRTCDQLVESKSSMASDTSLVTSLSYQQKSSGEMLHGKEPTTTNILTGSKFLYDMEGINSPKNQSCIANRTVLAFESSDSATKAIDVTLSLPTVECLVLQSSSESHSSLKTERKLTSDLPASLLAMDNLDTEEGQERAQHKPAKLPCKRKAISPLSREKLLQAANCVGPVHAYSHFSEGVKRAVKSSKIHKSPAPQSQEWVESLNSKNDLSGSIIEAPNSADQCKDAGHEGGTLMGSPSHNKDLLWRKLVFSQPCHSKAPLFSSNYVGTTAAYPQPLHSAGQGLSLVLNKSPSPVKPTAKNSPTESVMTVGSSPVPTKGILKSNSQLCQGACRCEECISVRFRAEKASEFSQRQMHDIEGLAVRLMKELGTLRSIVEEKLLLGSKTHNPLAGCTFEQVKIATSNAIEAEEMTRKWLVRMARDCNRYCKIMRMHQRKLSFADEAGGQLCHIKLFNSHCSSKPSVLTLENEMELPDLSMQPCLSGNISSKDEKLSAANEIEA